MILSNGEAGEIPARARRREARRICFLALLPQQKGTGH